jgi:hypothetical membrane protein
MDEGQLLNYGLIGLVILVVIFLALKFFAGETVPDYTWFALLIYGGLVLMLPGVFVWLLIPIIVILLLRYYTQLFSVVSDFTGQGGKK